MRLIDLSVEGDEEEHKIPVYVKHDGTRSRELISIRYQSVCIQLQSGIIMTCKIITNLLESPERSLSIPEIKALYIDFCMRHSELQPRSAEFRDALYVDPYVNALKVKYGYAATCHKAQGGEWNTVVVDFSGVTLCTNGLRWTYTATTRARKMLYGVNMPNVRPMDKLEIRKIGKMSRLPGDWPKPIVQSVDEILAESNYHVQDIRELPYRHRYMVSDGNSTHQLDLIYNAKGLVTGIQCGCEDLKALLLHPKEMFEPLCYEPSTVFAQQLYESMLDACEHSGTKIVGVKECIINYHILYYLQTDDKSILDFYFNGKGFVTYGTPLSMKGDTDGKLSKVVEYLI